MIAKTSDTKVDRILQAWLQFIEMQERHQEKVAGKNIEEDDITTGQKISLQQNNLHLDSVCFARLKEQHDADKANDKAKPWMLSFPQIYKSQRDSEKGKSELSPLFSLDISAIFSGGYKPEGWGIETFPISESVRNLTDLFNVEDEQIEGLITKEGLQRFLNTTFRPDFSSFEAWMEKASCKDLSHRKLKSIAKPYLFKATGGNFHTNLKADLEAVKASKSKSWMTPGQPAYDYLFGSPAVPYQGDIYYLGAFPTNLPTQSQLVALKQSKVETLTTIQGPPGSGKTTLILQAIAQKIVSRAVGSLKNQPDTNTLTMISSNNNKAIDNVAKQLENLEQSKGYPQIHFLQLNGGSLNTIDRAAAVQIQKAIDALEDSHYSPEVYEDSRQAITQIVADIEGAARTYERACQQQKNDKNEAAQIERSLPTLQQQLNEAAAAEANLQALERNLSYAEALPVEAYRQLEANFASAQTELPAVDPPKWQQWLSWTPLKTERQVIGALATTCKESIALTQATAFAVEQPTDRATLRRQSQQVKEGLAIYQKLQQYRDELALLSMSMVGLHLDLQSKRSRLRLLKDKLLEATKVASAGFYQTFHSQYEKQNIELFYLSQQLLWQKALHQKEAVRDALRDYRNFLIKRRGQRKEAARRLSENINETMRLVSLVFPVITSTLASARNMIPWTCQCLDSVILDEAGMVPVHMAFPLLTKTRTAVVVGDPLQIEPIVQLKGQTLLEYRETAFIERGLTEEDYLLYSPGETENATAYHRAANADKRGRPRKEVKLKEHFRCQESIIAYCRDIAKYDLVCCTQPVQGSLLGAGEGVRDGKNMVAYHVEGELNKRVNINEVEAVCQIVRHLKKQGYSTRDIGIVTPYRAQADALIREIGKQIPDMRQGAIGTIHNFQGAEKPVMICSAKVCPPQDMGALAWLNSKPNFLNVAVSRAKELFILVGNLHFLEQGGFTGKLIKHIETYGVIAEYKTKAEINSVKAEVNSVYKLNTETAPVIKNCDHIQILEEALNSAKNEICIVVPTIQGDAAEHFIRSVVAALERGVKVTVFYGTARRDRTSNAAPTQAEMNLQTLFMRYYGASLVKLSGMGTASKVLICDDQFAVVGCWGWLSHRSGPACTNRLLTRGVQIEDAISSKVVDPIAIEQMKAGFLKWRQ